MEKRGVAGFWRERGEVEPRSTAGQAVMLPLHYAPMFCACDSLSKLSRTYLSLLARPLCLRHLAQVLLVLLSYLLGGQSLGCAEGSLVCSLCM